MDNENIRVSAHLVALDDNLIKQCKKDRNYMHFALYRLKNAKTDNEYSIALNDFNNSKVRILEHRENTFNDCGIDLYTNAEKYLHNSWIRTQRLRSKIKMMFESDFDVLFLTFNFSDDVMEHTTEKTRRTYVSRFLKENCFKYVANIDFGSADVYTDRNGNERVGTEREHYHALVTFGKKIDYTSWGYGQLNGKRVVTNEKSLKRLPVYINKLTNHALKTSTKGNKIIYSRKTKTYTECMYETLK